MTDKNDYIPVYAVIRVDGEVVDLDSRVVEWEMDGEIQPTAGPANVAVKQIVMTAQEARDEVVRLNQINSAKGCKYYWQRTHLFLNGKSAGSEGRRLPARTGDS